MEGDKGGPADIPDAFLKALGESLKGKEGVDAGLAEILKTHILKVAPAQNAVALAKDAILKLAGDRANPPKPEIGIAPPSWTVDGLGRLGDHGKFLGGLFLVADG